MPKVRTSLARGAHGAWTRDLPTVRERASASGRRLTMLHRLKNFDTNRLALEEIFELETFGTSLRGRYEAHAIPTPDWLAESVRTLHTEATRRRRDELEKTLKELKAAQLADRSAAERREDRQKEIAAIQAAL